MVYGTLFKNVGLPRPMYVGLRLPGVSLRGTNQQCHVFPVASRMARRQPRSAFRMIDQAEQWLRQRGFHILRVRYHKDDLARIEVPLEDLRAFRGS